MDPELDPEMSPDEVVSEEALQEMAQAAELEAAAGGLAREFEKLTVALEQKTKEAEEADDKYGGPTPISRITGSACSATRWSSKNTPMNRWRLNS